MKKLLLVVFMGLLLTACTDNNDDQTKDSNQEESETTEADKHAGDIKEMEEYVILDDHIDLESLQMETQEDNSDIRVNFFEDELGEKLYKSVFVKDTNRLKIIDLDGEGLMFDDII
ncbi:hypothetical protein QGM71_16580 [Virgibacillus sp. C22-A2]|uniref:Lipoprotein n=1 Tax=Virgibacillus tibetensis TaxID=3042313 RepID=A0ABU6KJ14_9BACI|nr:hypothetical protein [Virgibacillus sp. C22-A2]